MQLHSETVGRGQDLVLIHGWGMNSSVWSSLVEPLSQQFRLTLIDMPGHGHSPYNHDWLQLDHWVDAVLQAAPQRAVWIGWSLGSMLAQRAAVLAPGRVQGLVAIAGTPCFAQGDGWQNAMERDTLRRFAVELQTDHAQTLERFLLLQAHGDPGIRKLRRPLREGLSSRPEPDDAALAVGLDLLLDVDLRGDLSRLICPSMWLLGRRDLLVPVAVAEDLQRLLPEAGIHVFRHAAHLPMLSDQARCQELLTDFIGGI